jgi:acyl-CoA synthetase (AMP-forming)/AMP-acid ligase II
MDDRDFLPDPALTFPATFAGRVVATPNATALFEATFGEGEPQAIPYTFFRLDSHIRRAASLLSRAGVSDGDRVALCITSPPDFLSFFLATQALGAIPVPLPSPSEFRFPAGFRERVGAAVEDCAPRALVSDVASNIEAFLPGIAVRPSIIVAGMASDDRGEREPPPSLRFERRPHETAFIQYTSGSSGSPKGVVVTHGNLIANMRSCAKAAQFGPDDRSVSWLPLYHDMGLVGGLLLGVYLGLATFVMRTKSFTEHPVNWLRAISQFRGTFACAPNVAYHLLVNRLPEEAIAGLDLSSWRLAFNGAEPIDRATVEGFARRFGPNGMSRTAMFPVYGMAECTLAIAFPTPGAPVSLDFVDRDSLARTGVASRVARDSPVAVCFVGVGRAVPEQQVRVLDRDANAEVSERVVGEIAVSGPSVSPYYFRTDGRYPSPRGELRTGDLGYIADGALYVVDRIKDLLILGGRNIVPSDVEGAVAEVGDVRRGSVIAFARRGSEGTDGLYLVVGVEAAGLGSDDLRQRIRRTVHERFGVVPRDVVVIRAGAVPKTSSGKIRRSLCLELYERGEFASDRG